MTAIERYRKAMQEAQEGHNMSVVGLMRLGPFYEAFDESALKLAETTNLVAYSLRENKVPMCGFHKSVLGEVLQSLVDRGHVVAIIE